MSAQPDPIPFVTDDQTVDRLDGIERRLDQLANGITHLEAAIPSLGREARALRELVAGLRRDLAPRESNSREDAA